MSEDFEKLKSIGAQKIYEQTHIARVNVENILSKSFSTMSKIQFKGFVSILEREYQLNLQELVEEYERNMPKESRENSYIFEKKADVKSNKSLLSVVLILILIVGYLFISKLISTPEDALESNTTHTEIMNDQKEMNATLQSLDFNDSNETNQTNSSTDANATLEDQNTTVENDPTQAMTQQSSIDEKPTKFQILTNKELWIGVVGLDNTVNRQLVIHHDFKLDPSKSYIFAFGHGILKIDLGTQIKEFNQTAKTYIKYQDGNITEITKDEFQALNKGVAW